MQEYLATDISEMYEYVSILCVPCLGLLGSLAFIQNASVLYYPMFDKDKYV